MDKQSENKQLRSFGLLVGGIFAVISIWPLVRRGQPPQLWVLILAGLLIVPALIFPRSLRLVYRVWMTIGHILGWINTRIILGMVFYGLFTPMGLVMRLLGNDPMRHRFEREADSYRIVRQPRPSSHLIRQF
jgi:hypothetical protein